MRAHEFIYPVEQDLDEGWKDTLGNLAIAGAMAGGAVGGSAALDKIKNTFSKDTQPVKVSTSNVSQGKVQDLSKITPKAQSNTTQQTKEPTTNKPSSVYKSVTGSPHENILAKAAMRAGIKGTELAAFLAQCAHETMDFKFMKEIGNAKTFKKYDPKYAPKKAQALGNTKVGDGEKYKGRGYIQLTGRHNYKKAGEELGLPLEKHPELVEKPEVAAKVAVWFWQHRVQPNVDNFNDVRAVTKTINPGMRGLQDRTDNFKDFKQLVASL